MKKIVSLTLVLAMVFALTVSAGLVSASAEEGATVYAVEKTIINFDDSQPVNYSGSNIGSMGGGVYGLEEERYADDAAHKTVLRYAHSDSRLLGIQLPENWSADDDGRKAIALKFDYISSYSLNENANKTNSGIAFSSDRITSSNNRLNTAPEGEIEGTAASSEWATCTIPLDETIAEMDWIMIAPSGNCTIYYDNFRVVYAGDEEEPEAKVMTYNLSELRTQGATSSNLTLNTYSQTDISPTMTMLVVPATAVGDWVEFTIADFPAGTYTMNVSGRNFSTRGDYKISVGATGTETVVCESFSFYTTPDSSNRAVYEDKVAGTFTVEQAGDLVVRMEVVGRNSASTNYQAYMGAFTFTENVTTSKTVTYKNENGNVSSTLTVSPDSTAVVLPTLDTDGFIGWTDGSGLYAAGTEFALDGTTDTELTALAVDNTTMDGAAVRLLSPTGLRFETQINKAQYDALTETGAQVQTGTLILPQDYLTDNGIAFTLDAIQDKGLQYLDIVNSGWYNADTAAEDGYYQYFGTIANIKLANYEREFTAVGYLKVIYDDGTATYIYAGDGSNTVRTVQEVAAAALADIEAGYTPEQIAILQGFAGVAE